MFISLCNEIINYKYFNILHNINKVINNCIVLTADRLCGLMGVLDYRCRGPGFDSRALQKKSSGVVGLERGPLSLMSTTEELLDRKVAAPV
jgi:hypothetical protein